MELAASNPSQTSQKEWGAAVQMPTAIAEQRVWEQSQHRHHYRVASRLLSETGDGDNRRFFDAAGASRPNFYEKDIDTDWVAESLDGVEALLAKPTALLNRT